MAAEFLKDENVRKILDKMRATCSVRERCTSEVREKISKLLTEDIICAFSAKTEKDSSGKRGTRVAPEEPDKKSIESTRENIISAIIASLTEDGFLSDSRYAAAFARDKAHLLGWGPQKIRYALLSKHLDDDIVNEAVALVDDSASANQLEHLLRRKLESLTKKSSIHTADPDSADCDTTPRTTVSQTAIREKLLRFALGRGYTLASALAALRKITLPVCLLVFLLTTHMAAGQDADYRYYENISLVADASVANCFVQDEQGMVWIGSD